MNAHDRVYDRAAPGRVGTVIERHGAMLRVVWDNLAPQRRQASAWVYEGDVALIEARDQAA